MVQAHHKVKLAAAWREGVAANSVRTLRKARSIVPAEEQAIDAEMKEVSAQVNKVQKELEGLVSSEKGNANLKAVTEQRAIYLAVRNDTFKGKADEASASHSRRL